MPGRELHGARRVGGTHEVACEDVRGGLVKAPVRQRHGGVDRLELALEVQEVRPVPGQEADVAVGLVYRALYVHVAEVAKASRAAAVQGAEGGDEAIALRRRERMGILPDP